MDRQDIFDPCFDIPPLTGSKKEYHEHAVTQGRHDACEYVGEEEILELHRPKRRYHYVPEGLYQLDPPPHVEHVEWEETQR